MNIRKQETTLYEKYFSLKYTYMARSFNNALLQGFSGKLGPGLIVKQYKNKIVISAMPQFAKRNKTPLQKLKSGWFAEAVQYARSIIRDPKKKAAWAKKLPPGKLVYHAAIQEYLKKKEGFSLKRK